MSIIEQYDAALDAKAAEFHAQAEQARLRGDERAYSIALMRESMLGDMLKHLGRADHGPRRGILQGQIEATVQRAGVLRARDDFDGADREALKAETIRFAMDTLRQLEATHG